MNNEVDQFFELATSPKGAITFTMLKSIAAVQALFPHVKPEEIISLYISAARQKIKLDTLIPLSLAERFGFKHSTEEDIDVSTPSIETIKLNIARSKEKEMFFNGAILYITLGGKSVPYVSTGNEKLDSKITPKKDYARLKITKEFRSRIFNSFTQKYNIDIISDSKNKITELPTSSVKGNCSIDFTTSVEQTIFEMLRFATFLEQGVTKTSFQNATNAEKLVIKSKAILFALKERLYAIPESPIDPNLTSNFMFGETAEERKTFFIDTCNALRQICLKLDFAKEIQTYYHLEKKEKETKFNQVSNTSTKEDWIKNRKQIIDDLLKEDPLSIYEKFGYFARASNGYYMLRMDGERTPNSSAWVDKNGIWKVTDHQSGATGNVLNVIAKYEFGDFNALGARYKECVDILFQHFGVAESSNSKQYHLNKKPSEQSPSTASVAKKMRILTNIPASEDNESKIYLSSRGIEYIPEDFRYINCLQESHDPQKPDVQVFGVGFINAVGGFDLRRLSDKGDPAYKVRNVGGKALVVFPPTDVETTYDFISLFESQLDYLAALQYPKIKELLEKSHIIISNSAGMYEKVVQYMEANDIYNVAFFNQNDNASQTMLNKILLSTPLRNFSKIVYKSNEKGQDINDLLKNSVNLEERLHGTFIIPLMKSKKTDRENSFQREKHTRQSLA